MKEWEIEYHQQTSMDDVRYVINRLDAFNLEKAPSTYMHKNIRLFVRGEEGQIIGGLLGMVNMNCLVIQVFWIEEAFRGQGMGGALMEKVIEIGKETDANWMTVETTSFQARPFYEKYGFKVIVELEDIPQGASTYILKKRIGD